MRVTGSHLKHWVKILCEHIIHCTFRFPPKIASSLEPAFGGGGDVADAGGVTLDALGGVCVTALVGELARPVDGERSVGEAILIGVTFND